VPHILYQAIGALFL